MSDAPDHVEGVEFTDINPILDELSYPLTVAELLEQCGDREIGRTNADPITIEALFDQMGEDTFESEAAVRQMILSQMPKDSEGRTHYSDRGGSTPVETEAAENASQQTTADLQDGPATNDRRD